MFHVKQLAVAEIQCRTNVFETFVILALENPEDASFKRLAYIPAETWLQVADKIRALPDPPLTPPVEPENPPRA